MNLECWHDACSWAVRQSGKQSRFQCLRLHDDGGGQCIYQSKMPKVTGDVSGWLEND